MKQRSIALFEGLTVTFLVLCFIVLLIVYPRLPDLYLFRAGLGYSVSMAATIAEMLKQNSFWRLFVDGALPGHGQSYQGVLMVYLFLPFQIVIGSKWWLYSFWHLLFVPPILLFTFLSVRTVFDRGTALLALLLLVVHPGFIAGMRMGGELSAHVLFFTTGALYFFVQGWTRRKTGLLALGMLFVVLALSTKGSFHWILAGLALVAGIYWPELAARFSERGRARFWGFFALGIGAVVGGYFLADGNRIFERFSHPESVFSLTDYVRRLPQLFGQVNECLSSAVFRKNEPFLTYRFWSENRLFPFFLWGSVLFLLLKHLRRQGKKRFLVFPAVLLACALLPPIIGDRTPPTYPFFFYPFPQLVIALAAVEALVLVKDRKDFTVLLSVFLLLFISSEVLGSVNYFRDVSLYGLNSEDRKVCSSLARWFRKNDPSGKIVLCYGRAGGRDELYRWSLAYSFPDVRVRTVFLRGTPEGKRESADLSYSVYEDPKAGETTFVFLEEHGNVEWPSELREWMKRNEGRTPLAQFNGKDGGVVFEIYPGPLPGHSPVGYALVPDWGKWEQWRGSPPLQGGD